MLYEKTLNRKILGSKQTGVEKSDNETNATGEPNGHANGGTNDQVDSSEEADKGLKRSLTKLLEKLLSTMKSIFARRPKSDSKTEKDAASMGKILNLMRYVGTHFWKRVYTDS
jgi:hypothetical protein